MMFVRRLVSDLYVSNRGRSVMEIAQGLLKDSSRIERKEFFEELVRWLEKSGWKVDVDHSKRTLLCEALSQSHNDPEVLFGGWVSAKSNEDIIVVPHRPKDMGMSCPVDKGVMHISDIWDDDRALFRVVKSLLVKFNFDKEMRKTFYIKVFAWLSRKGWVIPDDQSFGIHSVAAINRQCYIDNRSAIEFFATSIQKMYDGKIS